MRNHLGCISLSFLIIAAFASPLLAEVTWRPGQIVPIEQALTLAQVRQGGQLQTILVIEDKGSKIRGFNLSAAFNLFPTDPMDLVAEIGADRIRDKFERNDTRSTEFNRNELIIPPVMGSSQVAAGVNYADHGVEAGLDEVFLFPKFSKPSYFESTIPVSDKMLLDYEVELCCRFQQDISDMGDFQNSIKGFFLCGDFTDRAMLLRKIDIDDVASGRGFTDAKSGESRFPVGPYIVVPRDWSAFVSRVKIQTKVNGEIRQAADASEMIKKLDSIVSDTLQEGGDTRWVYQGKGIPLIDPAMIAKGQSILTGTPDGVVFNQPSTGYKIWKGTKWFFTLGFLRSGPVDYVLEEYIKESHEAKIYLQPGDIVELTSNYLGSIHVTIGEDGHPGGS